MDNPAEIAQAVSSFRTNSAFLSKRKRWEADFDLWRMAPYDAGPGYVSYTTNAPRVFAAKVISSIVGAKLNIRIPDDILTKELATTANNVERFCYGALNLNDERLLTSTTGSKLVDQLAWYAVVRGCIVFRVYVYKDKDGKTVTEIQPWDIYNTAYGLKDSGLDWAGNTYYISNDEALNTYGIKNTKISQTGTFLNKVECIDFWDSEKYGLIINGEWAEGPTKHECKTFPVHILPVGPMPMIFQQNYSFTDNYTGESVFASNRNIYPFISKAISDYATIVSRGVKPPVGVWSPDGDASIDEDIFQTKKGAVVHFKTGEEVKELLPATAPPDAAILLNWVSSEEQRGAISHVSYGDVSSRLSGYAISQLTASMESVIMPFIDCLRYGYEVMCRDLIEQYTSKKGLKPVSVRGRTSRNTPFGYPNMLDIRADDIKGDWHPEVELEISLPADEAQKILMAQQVRQGEVPLLSDKTIRSKMLSVQDPALEDENVELQFASKLPVIRLWKAYNRAIEEQDKDLADNILVELQRLLGSVGPKPASRPGMAGQPSPTMAAAAGIPGAGIPATDTGVPAQVAPPEQSGGLPPGSLNGQPPSGQAPIEGVPNG